jgi:hypothetical protein
MELLEAAAFMLMVGHLPARAMASSASASDRDAPRARRAT